MYHWVKEGTRNNIGIKLWYNGTVIKNIYSTAEDNVTQIRSVLLVCGTIELKLKSRGEHVCCQPPLRSTIVTQAPDDLQDHWLLLVLLVWPSRTRKGSTALGKIKTWSRVNRRVCPTVSMWNVRALTSAQTGIRACFLPSLLSVALYYCIRASWRTHEQPLKMSDDHLESKKVSCHHTQSGTHGLVRCFLPKWHQVTRSEKKKQWRITTSSPNI